MAAPRGDLSEAKSNLPPLHFIWAGDPPDMKAGGVVGHDIWGPIEMATYAKNKVCFWCFKKNKEHYEKAFDGHNITVHYIEDHLEKYISNPADSLHDSAMSIQTIMKTLQAEDRNRIRDLTNIKNIMSFFILASMGGFYMDTNIKPLVKKPFSLLDYAGFCVPYACFTKTRTCILDWWMMYSPPNDNNLVFNILKTYLSRYDEVVESVFKKAGYSKEYHDVCARHVLSSIKSHYKIKYPIPEDWQVIFEDSSSVEYNNMRLTKMNLVKLFFNTHRLREEPAIHSLLMDIIQHDDSVFLKQILDAKFPVNTKIDNQLLIEIALENKSILSILALWEYGAILNEEIIQKIKALPESMKKEDPSGPQEKQSMSSKSGK